MRLLNLAPHCTVPPLDGADRRAWHLHESMVAHGVDARFMGRNVIVHQGQSTLLKGERPGWRSGKSAMAAAALLTGQDYWQYKMLTPAFARAVGQLHLEEFDAVIVHFLYGLPAIKRWRGERLRLVVETHNFDPDIYGGLREAARNPLHRLLCERAARNSLRTLHGLSKETTLVHVSDSDLAAYEKIRPDLRHVVIENGCRVAPRTTAPDYTATGEKQLLFVGSLSAQMNQDALVHLSKVFWPSLRGVARLCVAGSNPSPAVIALCGAEGWELCPNVSDAELDQLYAAAHFALAPFAYGAGSKLKLMEACGRGVPILATPAGVTGIAKTPACVHVSNEPAEWRRLVETDQPTPQATHEMLDFAENASWPRLGAKFIKIVENAAVVTVP